MLPLCAPSTCSPYVLLYMLPYMLSYVLPYVLPLCAPLHAPPTCSPTCSPMCSPMCSLHAPPMCSWMVPIWTSLSRHQKYKWAITSSGFLLASNRLTLLQAGVLPQSLQSLDGIPQCLPLWLDGAGIGKDTQSYEYFSLCYDDPAPGQGWLREGECGLPSLPYSVSIQTQDWHFATGLVRVTKTQCL